MEFAWANTGMLAGADPALHTLNTENDLVIQRTAEESKLHWMVKVHDFLEMWQGSQNLRATQKESHTPNMHMSVVVYISDAEAIVTAS